MNISGKITGIKYKVSFADELDSVDFKSFDINQASAACIVVDNKNSFAVSKWVSPKRTRSYPYERIYNTLPIAKKITIIPVVKDEGAKGDRDFIQWDTVSLMSLLDVFVVFAYYTKAVASNGKITNQQFDNMYVLRKIKEIEEYHSSALHWNLHELKKTLPIIIKSIQASYSKIEKTTGIQLHNMGGLKTFQKKINKDVSSFMHFSREKAIHAQSREMVTVQPKEKLSTLTKASITITNYLGGHYYFTVDEVTFARKTLFLKECKHSKNSLLPSKSDIKDGLLKMILYCNLTETAIIEQEIRCLPVLELTSTKLIGNINSHATTKAIERFVKRNKLSESQTNTIVKLFQESSDNNFFVKIKHIQ